MVAVKDLVEDARAGGKGIALAQTGDEFWILDRGTGQIYSWDNPWWLDWQVGRQIPREFWLGRPFGDWHGGFVFCEDFAPGDPRVAC